MNIRNRPQLRVLEQSTETKGPSIFRAGEAAALTRLSINCTMLFLQGCLGSDNSPSRQ
jgi:hypothetical protein